MLLRAQINNCPNDDLGLFYILARSIDVSVSDQNSKMVDWAGFEPAASALPRRRSYQTDLPARTVTPQKRRKKIFPLSYKAGRH